MTAAEFRIIAIRGFRGALGFMGERGGKGLRVASESIGRQEKPAPKMRIRGLLRNPFFVSSRV
jgi:hypothetical protein